MPSLREIKSRIVSVASTQQITKAMKMVSAAKLKAAQDKIVHLRPYASKLNLLLNNITQNMDGAVKSPYTVQREMKRVSVIIITGDRGLCGGFNNNVIKMASRHIDEHYSGFLKNNTLQLICIGKKGYEYFRKRKYSIQYYSTDFFSKISWEKSVDFCEKILNDFREGRTNKVNIIYNEFKNVASQIVRNESFLPLTKMESSGNKQKPLKTDYIYEPSVENLIIELIPKNLKIKFFRAVLESNVAEQGARMTAMNQATDNANELLKALRLNYNRARQAKITKELIEIVSGADALSSS